MEKNNEMFPLKSGWAKTYIEAQQPIPENWRLEFYNELTSEDRDYRNDLEQAIRDHGVRWN